MYINRKCGTDQLTYHPFAAAKTKTKKMFGNKVTLCEAHFKPHSIIDITRKLILIGSHCTLVTTAPNKWELFF